MNRLRSIQAQLIASFLLFEVIALALFAGLLFHERTVDATARVARRLEYQSLTIAALCQSELTTSNSHAALQTIVSSMLQFPTIQSVTLTDPSGRVLVSTDRSQQGRVVPLSPQNTLAHLRTATLLSAGQQTRAVAPVLSGQAGAQQVAAYVWVTPSASALRSDFSEMLHTVLAGSIAVLLACTAMAAWLARSLSKPLSQLLQAMQRIIRDPKDTAAFPLAVHRSSETSDLILASNQMVGALEEQRVGLENTLMLLDSMLAHAPIGVAFFDRQGSIVRVNQFLADMHERPVVAYLGRSIQDVFAPAAAAKMSEAVEEVFARAEAVRDLEVQDQGFAGENSAEALSRTTWLMNIYPVRSANEGVRWAGALIVDISARLRAEETLRKTEKLAAAGRLAASIAHEINNPLEAVTNLLYLLEHHSDLHGEAEQWVVAAQHEVSRVSAITQQTLRFHRQSTQPQRTDLTDLLESVLTLHQGRINTLQVVVERQYRGSAELMCLSGELRQLFANLVGNALDSMQPQGGRLLVRAHPATSRHSAGGDREAASGVRITIADTGCGMPAEVRARIFEPFFTTKEATGTGLGLWVGAEIMTKHGVRLSLRSRVRHGDAKEGRGGTVFSLFFPCDGLLTQNEADQLRPEEKREKRTGFSAVPELVPQRAVAWSAPARKELGGMSHPNGDGARSQGAFFK